MSTFEWAKDFQTSDNVINEILEANGSFSIMPIIMIEMSSDGDNETRKLLWDYKHANEDERAAMDATLIHICGWSLKSLIEKEEEYEKYKFRNADI